ncbi:endonuclease/exonuclease/phosphatase family protein [Spirochaetota bacterium]
MKKIILILFALTVFTQCSNPGGGEKYIYSCPYRPTISTVGAYTFPDYNDYNTTALLNPDFIVMSRNLYLGASLTSLISDGGDVFYNTGVLLDDVIDSEIPRRILGIAREIEKIRPEIVALQEVVTFRTGKSNFTLTASEPDANCTEYNFLDLLEEALMDNNLSYNVAIQSTNADIELTDMKKDIRLTDSDVILVRSDINYTDSYYEIFNNNFSVSEMGLTVEIKRGYSKTLVDINGTAVHIVNTHLEVPLDNYTTQIAQVNELLTYVNGLKASNNAIILLGDFNVDPNIGNNTTYQNIIDSNFTDSWDGNEGYTCCYAGDLAYGTRDLLTRVDHIFYWNPEVDTINSVGSFITEVNYNETIIKTDGSEIWPSDHAGRITGFEIIE